jgi:hypothetical protein
MNILTDRIHRLPRLWSNRELAKFAHLFHGDVVNVSGWQDVDKEGRHYRDYFRNASSYTITNYKAEARGFQGMAGEIFLDLEQPLEDSLRHRFDVVFNHTTLEHIYDFRTAFDNLCAMSKDVVIVIVPFLQPYHSDYGDYWRFTPLALKKMFEHNGFSLLYLSFNSQRMSAVYILAIAARRPQHWQPHFDYEFSVVDPAGSGAEPYIGCRAIPNTGFKAAGLLRGWFGLPLRMLRRRRRRQ